MRFLAFLMLAMTAAAAWADAPMSAAQFDAYTQGKTLYFAEGGEAYGVEEYLEGRRVRWSFLDGECREGQWYEQNGLICFVYEDNPEPQCWSFYQSPGGLLARFENDPELTELYEVQNSDEPMLCLGPKIGV